MVWTIVTLFAVALVTINFSILHEWGTRIVFVTTVVSVYGFIWLKAQCGRFFAQQPEGNEREVVPQDEDEADLINGEEIVGEGLVANTANTEVVASMDNEGMIVGEDVPKLPPDEQSDEQSVPNISSQRLYFLDNLKTFLTFIVVAHHASCAFGGCGTAGIVVVGLNEDNPMRFVLNVFVQLNQGYFMCLFFFISAYMTSASYDRKGPKAFLLTKAQRYGIPLTFVTFLFFPLLLLFGKAVGGVDDEWPYIYIISPGHCWFLAWLLFFNFVYCKLRQASDAPVTPQSVQEPRQVPSIWKLRFLYGFLYCGVGMSSVLFVLGPGAFATMPLAIGSLVNDIVFFVGGIVAGRQNWLCPEFLSPSSSSSLSSSGSSIVVQLCVVSTEAAAMVWLSSVAFGEENKIYDLCHVLVAGMYCVDMSLVLIQLFYRYLNTETAWSKFFASIAYSVYLTHFFAITLLTTVWLYSYEAWSGNTIVFEEHSFFSKTSIAWTSLLVGWLGLNLATNLVVWPLGWCLRQAPFLRDIL